MIRLRTATAEDIPFIAACEKEYMAAPWTEEMLRQAMAVGENLFLLATEENCPIGYAGIQLIPAGATADILNIAVIQEYRRQGVGRLLMDGLFALAREARIDAIFLEVSETNCAACRLYESFGFEPVRVRKRYYPDGRDARIMRLLL